jgi:hypothetical protein
MILPLIAILTSALIATDSLEKPSPRARDSVLAELSETSAPELQAPVSELALNVAPYFGIPEFVDSVNATLVSGIVAYGFEPPLPEAIAYGYERKGDFAMANVARLAGDFLAYEDDRLGPSVELLLGKPYHSSQPSGLALSTEGSLAAAAAYFEGRGPFTPPDVAMFFDYLHRKFGLSWASSVVQSFSAYRDDPQFRDWQRMVIPGYASVSALLAAVRPQPWISPTNRDMLNALYCDLVPLRRDFFARVFWSSLQDGYDLTHAAIALEWAREQGCIGDVKLGDALRDAQVSRLLTQAAEKQIADDLFFEIVATLYYVGARDKVEERWLTRIVQAQLPDGGWAERPGSESNDHSTFLAYWALLEASHPDIPRVSMIPN